jgi:hypothetical protein
MASSSAKASAITAVIVVIIAGIVLVISTSGFTGTMSCPTLGCDHQDETNCTVRTGACRSGMCVVKLKAGAQCAAGWTNGNTGATCNPDTCRWR